MRARELESTLARIVLANGPNGALRLGWHDALDQIATEIGSPWMRENVVPLPAGPPERHIGPNIASSGP